VPQYIGRQIVDRYLEVEIVSNSFGQLNLVKPEECFQ
jgi:hypothetical protein